MFQKSNAGCAPIDRLSTIFLTAVLLILCFSLVSYSQPNEWRKVSSSGPEPRINHAMAYDASRDRVVLFGGETRTYTAIALSDTWEWDGTTWILVSTSGPTGRCGHAMAYDASRKRVVLFGGEPPVGVPDYSDTWEWDGSNWIQSTTFTAAIPAGRSYHDMVYDSYRQVVVLFGGMGWDRYQDTWFWNGTIWSRISDKGIHELEGHGMAYHADRDKVVLYGGHRGLALPERTTYHWDGNSWNEMTTQGPGELWMHSMVYDSQRNLVVLFGGNNDEGLQGFVNTWTWDCNSWNLENTGGPEITYGQDMVYDSKRNHIVLFGGGYGGNRKGDTWIYGPPILYDLSPKFAKAAPKLVAAGENARLITRIKNTGKGVSMACTLSFYLTKKPKMTKKAILLGSAGVPAINNGKSKKIKLTAAVPVNIKLGKYYVVVKLCVDDKNTNNNVKASNAKILEIY